MTSSLFKEQRRKYRDASDAGVSDLAVNCPGCYITLGFTSDLFRKRLHYMPEVLLSVYGDEITAPLGKRIPAIAKTVTVNLPRVMFR